MKSNQEINPISIAHTLNICFESLVNEQTLNVSDYYFNQTRVDRDKPRNLEFGLCFMDFFYELRMTEVAHKILETAQSPNSSFPLWA